MQIDKRFTTWNLNTFISLTTLAGMVVGGGYYWANTVRDIDQLKQWQGSHDQYHRERLVETQQLRGQNEERFKIGEKNMATLERKQDQMEYRLTVVEQQAVTQNQSMEGLKSDFNDVKGDIKVMREILQRIDKSTPK